jgi:hypothetical protein
MPEEPEIVEFSGLVAGLATSAMAVLGQIEATFEPGAEATAAEDAEPLSPKQRKKRITDGLAGARQLIDTLAMLEQKTKGNLDEDETQLLQGAIAELRIRYVSLANRPVPEGDAG